MTELPFISCLCPTYLRPRLLVNSLACYLAQDYPANRRELIILDDAGQIPSQEGPGWRVHSIAQRFVSLPEKYNVLAKLARGSVLVIWEDDDIYLPWHLMAHASCLMHNKFSKPSCVLSTYTGKVEQEPADGRFFASIAVTKTLWDKAEGIVATKRADFDQQSIAKFLEIGGQYGDPVDYSPARVPAYVFRWGSTGAYHGQAVMQGGDDEGWYDRLAATQMEQVQVLYPQFDSETLAVMQALVK